MRRLGILFALGLSSCAALTARGTDPTGQWQSTKPLDDVAACVVKAMDNADSRLTHAIQIKLPQRVYEVAPQQTITVGAEIYFVRLSSEEHRVRIELFSTGVFTGQMKPAVAGCAI